MTALMLVLLVAFGRPVALEVEAVRLCGALHVVSPDLEQVPESWSVCRAVALEAMAQGLNGRAVGVVLACSRNESRMRTHGGACRNLVDDGVGCVGGAGEIGPLQIKARWWCPEGKQVSCDPIQAGVAALRHLYEHPRYGAGLDWTTALAVYNGGPKAPNWAYADKVDNLARRLSAVLERAL